MAKNLKANKRNKSQQKNNLEEETALIESKKLQAKYYNNPVIGNANVVNHLLAKSSNAEEISAMMDEMLGKIKSLRKGDLAQIEEILLTQTHALQAMFVKAATYMAHSEYMEHIHVWSLIALKAQNQCRQTLATLVDIKFPRQSATFIKQQNNAVNQQVNNAMPEQNPKNLENGKNELLSEVTYEAMDDGRTQAASTTNTPLETLETIDRG